MDLEVQRKRDELLYSMVKGDRTLHLGLAIVYGACVVTAVVFLFFIVKLHKGLDAFIYDLGFIAAFGGMAVLWWNRYRDDKAALEEIGDDPTGIDTCRTYSKTTAGVIAESRKTTKELRQLWVAYGILGLVMLAMGVLMFALILNDGMSDVEILVITGLVMGVGGIILTTMAIDAFRKWIVAGYIEDLEERTTNQLEQ